MSTMSLITALLRSSSCPRYDYDMLDIPTDPEKTIQYVAFNYDCSFPRRAFVWLCADIAVTAIRYLNERPCSWQLGRKVENLTLISTMPLLAECVQTTVVYEEPEDWTVVAPSESYPLPAEPVEISKITFEAKTDAETASVITALVKDAAVASGTVTETPKTFGVDLTGGPYPVEAVSLANMGKSSVYIRSLTTE